MGLNKTILRLIVMLLVLALVVLSLKNCKNLNATLEESVVTYSDTTYITHIDTIEFEKIVTRTKTKYETVILYTQEDGTLVKQFITSIDDSLIEGTISTAISIDDTVVTLLDQHIDYIPKFPKYIYQTDSIFIHDSTVVTRIDNKINVLLGVNVSMGNASSITPTIGLQLKNKSIIELGYDPFNKNFMLGAKFKLKFK